MIRLRDGEGGWDYRDYDVIMMVILIVIKMEDIVSTMKMIMRMAVGCIETSMSRRLR